MSNLKYALAAVVLLAVGVPCRADTTFTLDQNLTSTSLGSTGPWLTATFHTVSTGDVQLTMTVKTGASGLQSGSYVADWVFNIVPPIPANIAFSHQSGAVATSATAENGENLPGNAGGLFDLSFNPGDGTNHPQQFLGNGTTTNNQEFFTTSVYDITGTGLTDLSFVALSSPSITPPNSGNFLSAAKIQGLAGGGSTEIGAGPGGPDGNPNIVPVPSSIVMLGMMLIPGALWYRRRKAAVGA